MALVSLHVHCISLNTIRGISSYVRCISVYDSWYFFIRSLYFGIRFVVFLHTFVVFRYTIRGISSYVCCISSYDSLYFFSRSLYFSLRLVVVLISLHVVFVYALLVPFYGLSFLC